MVLDDSGSMFGDKWANIVESARKFTKEL